MSELTKALIKFHCEVDKIDKNARANYGKFADLANVLSTVTPALLKNGLVLTQTFLTDSLVTTVRHVGGEEISSTCDLVVQRAEQPGVGQLSRINVGIPSVLSSASLLTWISMVTSL